MSLVVTVFLELKAGNFSVSLRPIPRVPKALALGYIVFAGCFVFPISSEPFPLDFQRIYLLVASYGVIALAYAGIFGPGRERLVYIATFLLTIVGLPCTCSNRDGACVSLNSGKIETVMTSNRRIPCLWGY